MSHPTWVRGLKLFRTMQNNHTAQSHPTWVRGLKPLLASANALNIASHPTWVRGLKPPRFGGQQTSTVAPYVGAWIETPQDLP